MKISDFMDMNELQKIQDQFSDATGLAAIAVDAEGNYITEGSNFNDFCMKYTRNSPEGNRRCVKCDNECTGTYYCHAGLMDFASDIVVNGEKVGAIIGGLTIFAEREYFDWAYLWYRIWELIRSWNPIPSLLLTGLNGLCSLVCTILTIYLAIMVGQMEQFNKYRVAVAVVVFFAVNWAFGLVEGAFYSLFGIHMMAGMTPEPVQYVNDVYNNYNFILGTDTIMSIIFCVLCFLGTAWMMKKKLNL